MNILRRISNNSYQKLYRNRHILAKDLNLNDQEYRLWDLYGALAGWDKRYEDIFQIVHATDEEIANITGWSTSKTCRTRNGLIRKKLVSEKSRGVYKILLIPCKDNKNASVSDETANLKDEVAPKTEESADLQLVSGKSDKSSLYSFNGVYGSIRTKEEYMDVKKREEEVSEMINKSDGWLSDDPDMKKLVDEQQRLAGLQLEYEIENDLIPDLA